MKNNIQKTCAVVTCVALGLMLILPLLCFNRDKSKISVVENKRLAQAPTLWNNNGTLNTKFIGGFENYFNDNIGFKQEAVVADIALSYKLFRKLKIPDDIEGKDGHIFYIPNGDFSKYQGTGIYSDKDIDIMVNGLNTLKSYLSTLGIPFIFMAIPDKDVIYPEFFPEMVYQFSTERTFDRLFNSLNKETDIDASYIKDDLIKAKDSDLLYYRNYDPSHWNMNGAFVGYIALMTHIKKYFPFVKILQKENFIIEKIEHRGTLAYLSEFSILEDFFSLDDTIYSYTLKDGYHSQLSKDLPQNVELGTSLYNYYHYHNDSAAEKKTLFILGDSYIYDYLLNILAESFRDVYFINESYILTGNGTALFEEIKPDCVVFENVEHILNISIYKDMTKLFSMIAVDPEKINGLTEIEITPQVLVDTPHTENGKIYGENGGNKLHISGWTYEPNTHVAAAAVFLQLGGAYYMAQVVERPDLVNGLYPDMLWGGFQIDLPAENLKSGDLIKIIVCSADGKRRFLPVEYTYMQR